MLPTAVNKNVDFEKFRLSLLRC